MKSLSRKTKKKIYSRKVKLYPTGTRKLEIRITYTFIMKNVYLHTWSTNIVKDESV